MFRQVLDSGWRAQPLRAARTEFNARGRRTWIFIGPCIRRAFDNPDLIVACVIGDGESETCPLEGSWKSVNFVNPVRDGAVLPILHLNGYKISGPTAQGRTSDEDLKALYVGRGYKPYFVEGDDPEVVHQLLAANA